MSKGRQERKGPTQPRLWAPDNLSKPVNRRGRKGHIENFYVFFVVKFFSPSVTPTLTLALWEREWVRVDRQRKCKLAALADFALHPDLSAMQLDKFLGQG